MDYYLLDPATGEKTFLYKQKDHFSIINQMDILIAEAIKSDNGERLNDCINNLLRNAAKGEEWATKLLFERLDNATAKK